MNGFVYVVTKYIESQRIEATLTWSLEQLETGYKALLHQDRLVVEVTFENVKQSALDILQQLPHATKEQKKHLRKELHARLQAQYQQLRKQGVYQLHFSLPDNSTFLRMHRPERYGDDLTKARPSVAYVNRTHQPFDGFEGGRLYMVLDI